MTYWLWHINDKKKKKKTPCWVYQISLGQNSVLCHLKCCSHRDAAYVRLLLPLDAVGDMKRWDFGVQLQALHAGAWGRDAHTTGGSQVLGPFVFRSQKLAVSARGWQNPSATQGGHICKQASVVLRGHSGTGFEGSKVCQNHWSCCRDLQGWGEGISSSQHWLNVDSNQFSTPEAWEMFVSRDA